MSKSWGSKITKATSQFGTRAKNTAISRYQGAKAGAENLRVRQISKTDDKAATSQGRKSLNKGAAIAGGAVGYGGGKAVTSTVDKYVAKHGRKRGLSKFQSAHPIAAKAFLPKSAKVASRLANRGVVGHAIHGGARFAAGQALGFSSGKTKKAGMSFVGHTQGRRMAVSGVGGANVGRYASKVAHAQRGYYRTPVKKEKAKYESILSPQDRLALEEAVFGTVLA